MNFERYTNSKIDYLNLGGGDKWNKFKESLKKVVTEKNKEEIKEAIAKSKAKLNQFTENTGKKIKEASDKLKKQLAEKKKENPSVKLP